MDFYDVVRQTLEQLRRDGRTTYLALKRQFGLDDEALDDLKKELLYAHPVVNDDGRGLVWTGETGSLEPDIRHGVEAERRFHAMLSAVMWWLQRDGRVTYRTLTHLLGLNDALLDEIREDLSFRGLARDQDGKGLVWTSETQPTAPSVLDVPIQTTDASTPAPFIETSTPSNEPTVPAEVISTDVPQYASTSAPEPIRSVSEAERRQLTVMFCDLADSTQLSQQLDPEDLREVVRAYQATAAEVIEQYEGHMAQYLGDGLLIYFGWPAAHEDDAQRAAHAGLGIVEAITTTLNPRLEQEKGVQLTVRLGVHTGPVVVGEMGGGGRHENLATGETVNIAARLEGLATPNAVVISNVTARLVQDAFVLQDLGAHDLKGVAEPMSVYRVDSLREVDHESDDTATGGFAALVGRDEEIGLLLRRWEQSKEGFGQAVLMSGEAGIGKSCLVEGLRQHVRQEDNTRITFRCSEYVQQSALYPVIEHLHRVFDWQREDDAEIRLAKLAQVLELSSLPLDETVPLIAALLSLPLPEDRYAALTLSPQQQRQQTQDVLVAWMLEEAERQPVLVVWEDLHWADPSTLELLGLFIDQVPTVSMLNVLVYRPTFVPPWPTQSHMTPLTLNRLERPQVEAFIMRLASGKPLPTEVVAHVVGKTDGVPLYVEELTKMLLESDLLHEETDCYTLTGSLATAAIPSTLHDSLMARLDRLPTVREVVQLGAVLGREFAYEMLQFLVAVEEVTLQEGLRQLVDTELLYQRGRPPRATYTFRHALIRDTAYQSLLRRTRQQYHQRVAQVLETRFPEIIETQPELVAYHYTEAGLAEQAIDYWQQAGAIAKKRSAHAEAIHHFSKGLEALNALPETSERQLLELDVRIALGPELIAAKGFAVPAVEANYSRAQELCEQVGETPQLFPARWGLWIFNGVKADHRAALDLAKQLLRSAQHFEEPALLLQAHHAMWMTLFHRAELTSVRMHCEQGIQLYDPHQHHAQTYVYGNHDPGVCARGFGCRTLWLLGYPAQARRLCDDMLTLARQLNHPFSLVQAHSWAMWFYLLRGEFPLALNQAVTAIVLATEQGIPYYKRQAEVGRGWLLAATGDVEAGVTQIQEALAEQAVDHNMRPWSLSLMADAYGKQGQIDAGLRAIATGLDASLEHEVFLWQAPLLRLKGELLLKQAPSDAVEAESCLHQSLDVARAQQAKSWELRTATSLARLWQSQGKCQDAYDLLQPIYAWFTEGFDTADLQDAKALLDEL